MKRLFCSVTVILFLVGCRAPVPSLDVLAPYGTTRVPPPSTGSYGNSGNYYQQPAGGAAVGTGVRSGTASTTSATSNQVAAKSQPAKSQPAESSPVESSVQAAVATQSPTASDVQPATFTSDDNRSGTLEPVRVADANSGSASNSLPLLNGMRVNDVVTPAEPAAFQPPPDAVEISQLPKPPASISKDTVTVTSAPVTTASSSTTAGSATSGSSTASGSASLQWKSRSNISASESQ